MLHRQLSLAAGLGVGVALLAGCDKQVDDTVSAQDCQTMRERIAQLESKQDEQREPAATPEDQARPTFQVELPTPPDFESTKVPIQWEGDPDSAYSIYGLRKDIDEHLREGELGQTVVVKGWVQEIYVPPMCREGELCPPAKQPHFWITDHQGETGKKRAMMVVNYYFPIPEWDVDAQNMWRDQPLVSVEVGERYTIKGTFRRFSTTGFAHDNGLIEFHSYKAPNPDPKSRGEMIWIYPPNTDWHPLATGARKADKRRGR